MQKKKNPGELIDLKIVMQQVVQKSRTCYFFFQKKNFHVIVA